MANALDTAIDEIQTALDGIESPAIRRVARRPLNAFAESAVPAIGLFALHVERSGGAGGTHTMYVGLHVLARSKDTKADESITEIMAAVEAALDTLTDTTAKPSVTMPRWDFWYAAHGKALVPCGAQAVLRVQHTGALSA